MPESLQLIDPIVVPQTEQGLPAYYNSRERPVIPKFHFAQIFSGPSIYSRYGHHDGGCNGPDERLKCETVAELKMQVKMIAHIGEGKNLYAILLGELANDGFNFFPVFRAPERPFTLSFGRPHY